MKILLYGINYAPELTGIGKYSGELAEWLSNKGHEVQAVTAPPYYPEWQVQAGFSSINYSTETLNGVKVTRCPVYIPKNPGLLKRMIHLISFALGSAPVVLSKYFWKPDIVICVVPSLFCAPAAILLSALRGCSSIVHVQDFEVDAMLGLEMASEGFFLKVARWYERFALLKAARVSTISASMIKRAVSKGVPADRLMLFPNWSEVSRFLSVSSNEVASLKQRLCLSKERKICLYSGNIGDKQGLEDVVTVANSFREEPVEFVFVGQGAGLDRLVSLANELELDNVRFLPLQPYEDLPTLLSMADCHLVVQKKGVADAVLPSKLTNILAAGGHALITAEPDTELSCLCREHPGIAELVCPEDVDAIEVGIRKVLAKDSKNDIAQQYAKAYLDKETVLAEFETTLSGLIEY